MRSRLYPRSPILMLRSAKADLSGSLRSRLIRKSRLHWRPRPLPRLRGRVGEGEGTRTEQVGLLPPPPPPPPRRRGGVGGGKGTGGGKRPPPPPPPPRRGGRGRSHRARDHRQDTF